MRRPRADDLVGRAPDDRNRSAIARPRDSRTSRTLPPPKSWTRTRSPFSVITRLGCLSSRSGLCARHSPSRACLGRHPAFCSAVMILSRGSARMTDSCSLTLRAAIRPCVHGLSTGAHPGRPGGGNHSGRPGSSGPSRSSRSDRPSATAAESAWQLRQPVHEIGSGASTRSAAVQPGPPRRTGRILQRRLSQGP